MDPTTLARYIKEIGRGRNAAGDLTRVDARSLFSAMLSGEVPDLQLGAILIALRIKGESLEELAGFAAACEASYNHLPVPATSEWIPHRVRDDGHSGESQNPFGTIPIVIPAYNGARQLPNLVPLLALLLARKGVPVLIHGVMEDLGRVTTREVLAVLGIAPALSIDEARAQIESKRIAFMPVEALAPKVAVLLALRRRLGVRNSTHTLAKMLQPFAGPAIRIVSVTHPDYLVRMREYFTTHDTAALLLRGAEGEAVAHPRREPAIDWAYGGTIETWADDVHASKSAAPTEIQLPHKEADATARWIEDALAGRVEMPRAIEHQIECCVRAGAILAARKQTFPPLQAEGEG